MTQATPLIRPGNKPYKTQLRDITAAIPKLQKVVRVNIQDIRDIIQTKFGEAVVVDANTEATDPWLVVETSRLNDICRFLRETSELEFDHLNDLCGVDYLETDPKKAIKFGHDPHIEVVYHLSSISKNHRIKLKVIVPRWKDDQPGQLPVVPSVASVWKIAEWHEREAFDLIGIHFAGNPNLQRILCPDDWAGHALRKDYDFPLEYHGIRAR